VRAAKDGLDVATGDVGKFLAAFKGVQVAVVAHGPQERDGQGAGTYTGFNYPGAWENIGHGDNLAGVLRINHSGAAGHGKDKVREQRAQRLILLPNVVHHNGAVGFADDLIMVQETAVGVEGAAGFKRDGVHAAAFIGQLDPLAFTERSAAAGSPHRLDTVGSPTCGGRRCCGRCCGCGGRFAAHESSSLL
jgi:hypothetical protein